MVELNLFDQNLLLILHNYKYLAIQGILVKHIFVTK